MLLFKTTYALINVNLTSNLNCFWKYQSYNNVYSDSSKVHFIKKNTLKKTNTNLPFNFNRFRILIKYFMFKDKAPSKTYYFFNYLILTFINKFLFFTGYNILSFIQLFSVRGKHITYSDTYKFFYSNNFFFSSYQSAITKTRFATTASNKQLTINNFKSANFKSANFKSANFKSSNFKSSNFKSSNFKSSKAGFWYNLFTLKALDDNTVEVNKINYMYYAKLFFISLNLYRRHFSHDGVSAFRLTSNDYINNQLLILTKHSKKIHDFEFLKLKEVTKNANSFIFLLLEFSKNSSFIESNFSIFLQKKNVESYNFYKINFIKRFENDLLQFSENVTLKKQRNSSGSSLSKGANLNLFSPNFKNFNFLFSKIEVLIFLFFKPVLLKFFFAYINVFSKNHLFQSVTNLINLRRYDTFKSGRNQLYLNNLLPNVNFIYLLKKKIIKVFNYLKFNIAPTPWFIYSLVTFIEFCSGKKVFIKIFSFINNYLNFYEQTQCFLWSQKIKNFRKMLGPKLYLNESLQILYLALKLKDPFLLSNWISSIMQKISFWKHRLLFHYLKYVLRYFFWVNFKELKIKGIKFQLKGKISVAGNARTRTILMSVGYTSHSSFSNKILYNLNLIPTFTGVLGLRLWLVF